MISHINTSDAHRDGSTGPQGVESVGPEVLNLQELYNRCMGNIDLVQRILEKFQQQLPEELAELERVLELNDAEQIARAAHRIKGTSANMSAEGLRRTAAEIETLCRSGHEADLPAPFERLRCECKKYLEYTSTLLPTGSVGSVPESTAMQ
jgi:HPt (histidine-containing phosphotransfer) domain-containing protein